MVATTAVHYDDGMHRALVLALLVGCTPTTFAFSPTINGTKAKQENCPFEVLTSPPTRDFEEIGTLDFYNGPEPKTLAAFKSAVSNQVCAVGGDAVVATVDAKGVFSKGTVIGYTNKYDKP